MTGFCTHLRQKCPIVERHFSPGTMFEGLDSMAVSSVAAAVVMTCAHSADVTANAELKAFADTLLLRFANQGTLGYRGRNWPQIMLTSCFLSRL
jgi:hypothetical protein